MPDNTVKLRIQALRSLPTSLGDQWFAALENRKKEEAVFHDHDREGHRDEAARDHRNRRFYAAAQPVSDYIESWLNRVGERGIFLDYACGNGNLGIKAVQKGAPYAVGIDISPVSVANARENAVRAGISERTLFLQRDCEQTGLPDATFDAVLCCGMLHHLDLTRAFPELYRILRPGGRILCVEALAYNPIIQLYRELTPDLRTEWEKAHILSMKDVQLARQWFAVENLKFHCLTSPLATLLPVGPLRRLGLGLGHAIDSILTGVPLLQLWSWQFTFELVHQ